MASVCLFVFLKQNLDSWSIVSYLEIEQLRIITVSDPSESIAIPFF